MTKIKQPRSNTLNSRLERKESQKARDLLRKGMRVAKNTMQSIATDTRREVV